MPEQSSRQKTVGYGVTALLGVAGIAVILNFAIPKVHSNRQRDACFYKLRQIGVALQNYHDAFKCFPPAMTLNADGEPMHSWRLLVLPFMVTPNAYHDYNRDEPWNGPNNSKLTNRMPDCFRCPASTGASHETNYVVVVGNQTAMPGTRSVSIHNITDGVAETIMLIEVANSGVPWLEPRDLTIEEALKGVNAKGGDGLRISSDHPGGACVGYCNSRVGFLENGTTPEQLKKLLLISDNQ